MADKTSHLPGYVHILMPRLGGASRSKASATLPVWSSTFSLFLLPLFWSALARQRFSRRYQDTASPVARLLSPRSHCSFQRVRLSPGTRRRVATPEAWYRDTALQSASGSTSVWLHLIPHSRAFSRLHSPRHGLQSVISRADKPTQPASAGLLENRLQPCYSERISPPLDPSS